MAVNRQPPGRCRSYERPGSILAGPIKTWLRDEALSVIHVGRQREEREILAIHVVFQIKDTRKSGAGDFGLVPRTIRLLRAQKETQTALNARPIEIAAGASAHDRPRRLRRRALAHFFHRPVIVTRDSSTPAAVLLRAALA